MSDQQLRSWIQRSRGGDTEAFSRIVDRFQAKVSAVTFSMTGNLQESEDIAQETFLVAWKKLAELEDPEKIGAWLCGIARTLCKKCFDHRRRDPLHAAVDLEPDAVPEPNNNETEHRRQEQARLAWSAIEKIPETYREPLILFYRDGRSIRDVAETLQLTEDCVKQRLHRGRQYLKQEIERSVEAALEATRPDTAFTLAVLASIPLATASGCTVGLAGAGGMAGGTGGPMGIGGGMGFFGAALAVLCALLGLLVQSATFIVFWLIYLWLLWQAIKNSPTVRTRRFVVGAALDYAVLIVAFSLFERFVGPLISERNFYSSEFYAWFGFLPVELRNFLVRGLPQCFVLAVFVLYVILHWRQLLYEDLTDTENHSLDQSRARKEAEEEQPDENPWHRIFQPERQLLSAVTAACRRWRDAFLTANGLKTKRNIVLGIIVLWVLWSLYRSARITIFNPDLMSKQNISFIWYITAMMGWYSVLLIAFQVFFFRIIRRGIDISVDESALERSPPKYPASAWKTESAFESIAPEGRRGILVDSLVLMAAIPLAIQFLVVVLGTVRAVWQQNSPSTIPLVYSMNSICFVQIVLVALTALYVSARPARRFAAFSLLFFAGALVTLYYTEWPMVGGRALGPLLQHIFWWWLPPESFGSPLSFWDEQKMYRFHHILAILGGGYLFLASAICYIIHRASATCGRRYL